MDWCAAHSESGEYTQLQGLPQTPFLHFKTRIVQVGSRLLYPLRHNKQGEKQQFSQTLQSSVPVQHPTWYPEAHSEPAPSCVVD